MSQCPQCGTATTVGQPFCGACGATLAPAAESPASDEGKTQIRPQQPTEQFSAQPPAQQPPASGGDQYGAPQDQGQGYPPQQGGQHYPQQQYGAPQNQGRGYPPQQGGQQQYGAPQNQGQGYPPQQGGQQQYGAPQGQGYPPQQGGQHYPQQQYGAPQNQGQGYPPQQGGQQQYGDPQGGGSSINFDFSKLLIGNWAGMAMVAGGAFVTALVTSLIWALTIADKLHVGSALGAAGLLTGSTFGADLVQDAGKDATLSVGQYPLLGTVLALGVALYLFRRFTASYTDVKTVLLDALRAALMLALMMLVLAIVMKIWEPDLKGYDSTNSDVGDWQFLGAPLTLGDGKTTTSIAGAIFLPLIILGVVLALFALTRRDWMGEKMSKVHDFVAAPIIGFTTLIVITIPAGVLYMVALIVGEKEARGFSQTMAMLANLPGLGLHMMGLGALSKLGLHVDSSDSDSQEYIEDAIKDEGGAPSWIGDFAGDHGMLFWIALLVGVPALVAAVWMVVKRSTGNAKPLYNVGVYLGSMVVVIPILVRFANIHISQSDGSDDLTVTGGLSGGNTLLLFLAFSLVAAAVILVVTGNLDVNALKSKAANFQSQPGQQQPGQQQQQWGQQQPPQQQWGQPQPPQQQWGQQPGQQEPGQQQWGQPQPPQQQPYGEQPPQQGGWQPPTQ